MIKYTLILILQLCFFSQINAQFDDIEFEDLVYYDHLKSVEFIHDRQFGELPIVNLKRPASLLLKFDDLEAGDKLYTYRIIHCNRNWQPSELDDFEYLDGFNGEEIDNIQYSAGTLQDYTHYELTLPNDDIRWTLSGNYLLVVYEGEIDEGIPVISKKFMVTEQIASIGMQVDNPRSVMYLKSHHKINLTLNLLKNRVSNPLEEITATIYQNARWDNVQSELYAENILANQLIWRNNPEVIFGAAKPFRNFRFFSLKYVTDFIFSIDLEKDNTYILLDLQQSRKERRFIDDFDLNGRSFSRNDDRPNTDTQSEYAKVIFTYEQDWPYDKDMYIIGAFNNWKALPAYKMDYVEEDRLYYKELYLKQGYYDYFFATSDGEVTSTEETEGNFFETANQYTAIIYYAEYGTRFDRIIAVNHVQSEF